MQTHRETRTWAMRSLAIECMNKQEQQYQIRKQEQQDTQQADTWIKQQGLNTGTFGITNLQLLQAQQTAHTLLTAHKH